MSTWASGETADTMTWVLLVVGNLLSGFAFHYKQEVKIAID